MLVIFVALERKIFGIPLGFNVYLAFTPRLGEIKRRRNNSYHGGKANLGWASLPITFVRAKVASCLLVGSSDTKEKLTPW